MKRALIAFFFLLSSVPAWAAAVPAERASIADLSAIQASADPDHARLGALLAESLAAYENVRDYEALFRKTETEEGKMGPEERIFLKFEKPFKIFIGWKNTRKKGLQVHYERGRHGNKLGIHKPGLLLGLAPVIFLEQSSPYVRVGSEAYDIEDAGIGTFLYDLSEAVAAGDNEKKLLVLFAPDGTADVRFPGDAEDDVYFAARVVVRFDKTTRLPVYMELYNREGSRTGTYAYDELKVNVGSDTAAFKKESNRQLYRIYSSQK
jgi:hypothetical protein